MEEEEEEEGSEMLMRTVKVWKETCFHVSPMLNASGNRCLTNTRKTIKYNLMLS